MFQFLVYAFSWNQSLKTIHFEVFLFLPLRNISVFSFTNWYVKLIKHYRGAGCPRYNFTFVRLSLSCISQVGGCACVVTEHRIHRTSRFHPWLPGYSLSSCFVWRARCNDLTCCLKVYTSLPKEVLYVPIEHLKYIFCPFLREIVFIVFNSQILC